MGLLKVRFVGVYVETELDAAFGFWEEDWEAEESELGWVSGVRLTKRLVELEEERFEEESEDSESS